MNQPNKTLQLVYAAALIDSLRTYTNHGITKQVEAEQRSRQAIKGAQTVQMLGITDPEDIFQQLSTLFGCAHWTTVTKDNTTIATTSQCLLCALAKRQGTDSPCALYCTQPIEGILQALDDTKTLFVEDTLFAGDECRFRIE